MSPRVLFLLTVAYEFDPRHCASHAFAIDPIRAILESGVRPITAARGFPHTHLPKTAAHSPDTSTMAQRLRHPRTDHRFAAQGLSCPIGEVADISASGMRIRCASRPPLSKGQIEHFTVAAGGRQLQVAAEVVWIRRPGLRSRTWHVGVRFSDQRPALRRLMEHLGEFGFFPESADEFRRTKTPRSAPTVSASIQVDDLYALFGLKPGADESAIRSAYHRLAQELHPDRSQVKNAAQRFAEISKAYKVLRDPDLRARYDEMLTRSKAA